MQHARSQKLGVLEERYELPSGARAEPRPPKGFPPFSTLRVASPDTIILLIVDYHAAIGGRPPCPCPLCTPVHEAYTHVDLLL